MSSGPSTARVARGKPADPCGACPLGLVGEGFVRGDGPFPASLMLVGEAPGRHEAISGKPFVGAAGQLLDSLLRRAGIDRTTCRVANVICCRPPRNELAGMSYEHAAIARCAPLLEEEISITRPKAIVALGQTALRRLTGETGISRWRGFPIQHPSGAWVIPTYHPSYLLPRSGQKDTIRLTGIVILDLHLAHRISEEGFSRSTPVLELDPPPFRAEVLLARYEQALREGHSLGVAVDIETPGRLEGEADDEEWGSTQILRVGFSWAPGEGCSVPWTPEYRHVIQGFLLAGPVITWNGYGFDVPILELNGMRIPGRIDDAMWAWHVLQSDLPRNLEFVTSHYAPDLGPWKHLSEADPARYNALDALATYRCFMGIREDLQRKHLWTLYETHVVELAPFLREAGQRGVSIDQAAREALRQQLLAERDEILREAQRVVPREFHAVTRMKRKPSKWPAIPVESVTQVKVCAVCRKPRCRSHRERMFIEQPVTTWQLAPEFDRLSGDDLLEAVTKAGFNPGSPAQVKRYARARGHTVETLDRTTRDRLIRRHGDPVYELSQRMQDIQKTLGTYVEGYRPNAEGRITTVYTFAPSTGRLSSRNVNLQNVSKRADGNRYSEAVRRMIVPRPGCVFVEADSAAIEAVMTGWFMEDPTYIELARLGIHDYITCLETGRPFDPQAIRQYRKDPEYSRLRERNKRVIHGTNYGMSPRKMFLTFPEHFPTELDARLAQQQYFRACPKLPEWQHKVRMLAHRQTWLQNPWGYRHYFHGVFVRGAQGQPVPGPDAKRVVAFLPQSSAAAFMRDSLRLLASGPFRSMAPAIVSIHDSICLEVPEALRDEAAHYLLDLLTRPIPQMDGLRIGAEVKWGTNWKDMVSWES